MFSSLLREMLGTDVLLPTSLAVGRWRGAAPSSCTCWRRHATASAARPVPPIWRCRPLCLPWRHSTGYRGGGVRTSLRRRSSKLRLSDDVILLSAAADNGWDAWNRCSPPYFGKRGVAWDCFVHDFGAADTGYEARSLTAMISSLRQNAGAICGHPPRVR